MFSQFKIILISAAIISVMSLGFYWYYSSSQTKIETLQASVTTYKESNESKDKLIAALNNNIDKSQVELKKLNSKYSSIVTENNKLKQKFKIGKITSTNQKSLEQKVNDDYNNLFLEINDLTNLEKIGNNE